MSAEAEDMTRPRAIGVLAIQMVGQDIARLRAMIGLKNRLAKQVWDYVEAELQEGKDVSPGIVFADRPRSAGRLQLIERLFDEEGIPVVWQDETNEERRAR